MDFGNPYWGDNVPADIPPARDVTVTHECPNGHKWDVVMDQEFGSYFYYNEDEDPYCPICGLEHV